MMRSCRSHEHVQLKRVEMDLESRRARGIDFEKNFELTMTGRAVRGDDDSVDRSC
jgi:hypothetical protein